MGVDGGIGAGRRAGFLRLPGFLAAVAWLLWVAVALANIPSCVVISIARRCCACTATSSRRCPPPNAKRPMPEMSGGAPSCSPAGRMASVVELPKPSLTPEEQAFLDGPVDELCRRIDDWQITYELHDSPPELWEFIKARRFLGMMIPKDTAGSGSRRNPLRGGRQGRVPQRRAAVTVMVPNSLGPAELLMH